MSLSEYILDKISLFDYYDKFIVNLDEKFKQYSYNTNKLVLCYFKDHADVNPSMGWINSKNNKNIKVCHCFGCGRTANVVRLHQILCSQWLGKEFTEKEACLDLAKIFNIALEEIPDEDEDINIKYQKRLERESFLENMYSVQDFKLNLRNLRRNSVDLNKLNKECVKLIVTKKQLYT